MKLYSIKELEKMTDSEVEDAVNKRGKSFIKLVSDALQGEEIKAFGNNSRCLWGSSDETLSFTVKKIKLSSDAIYLDGNKANLSLDIYLNGYDDSKKYGMMYTDEKGEKSIQDLVQKLLGKEAKISWSEQGMQGDNFVSVDCSVPAKLIAPDVRNYQAYLNKVEKLKEKSDTLLEPIENLWPAKIKHKK